ncbi:stage III sporulation protein AA [Paenibacillus abyssi]|uniref:Stage III sporulation protein AA n=1 Tax=Paenibacillus abyssi TaxID=1340531 RepID=A0A917FJW0_9BACL|nr:stage III sporulation protein AA [Paenibacillus abyssi]GGF87004.1 stage III sporulation protein AA [Paenibacillus abyssi]
MLTRVMHLLPLELQAVLERLPEQVRDELEEIRVREGRPLEISYGGLFRFASADGSLSMVPTAAYKPEGTTCRKLLERITNHSLYAMEEELKRGYITVGGGHRIGLAGRTVLEAGAVRGIREVGGFNIRIAREVVGAADRLQDKLMDWDRKSVLPTLIIGPPQQGKTTVVRDLARSISYGRWLHPGASGWPGRKVAIVDERSEIAACMRGVPTFDVGPRTDVMDACPKAEGMMMLLRSMSPEILIVDEIGRREDSEAIREASHAGVSVIATAHAYDLEDAKGRPVLRGLLEEGVFAAVVVIRRSAVGAVFQTIPLGTRARAPAAREPTETEDRQAIARGQPVKLAISSRPSRGDRHD